MIHILKQIKQIYDARDGNNEQTREGWEIPRILDVFCVLMVTVDCVNIKM